MQQEVAFIIPRHSLYIHIIIKQSTIIFFIYTNSSMTVIA